VYGLRHGPIDNTTPAFVGDNTNASGDMTKHSSSVHMYVATLLKETILIDVLVPMYSMAYYSCPLFVHRGMGSLQHINKYLEACNKGEMMWKQREDLSAYTYQGTSVCTLVEATVSFFC